jgi:hypothetical protein
MPAASSPIEHVFLAGPEDKLHVLTAGAYISDAGMEFQQTGSRPDFTFDCPPKIEDPLIRRQNSPQTDPSETLSWLQGPPAKSL